MPEHPYPITGGPEAEAPRPDGGEVVPEARGAWPLRLLGALVVGVGVLMLLAYGPLGRVAWGWMIFWGVLAAAILFGLATLFGNARSRGRGEGGAKRIS